MAWHIRVLLASVLQCFLADSIQDSQRPAVHRPVKVSAIIYYDSKKDEGTLFEVFGHVTLVKPLRPRVFSQEELFAIVLGRSSSCIRPNGELGRCSVHSLASLQDSYHEVVQLTDVDSLQWGETFSTFVWIVDEDGTQAATWEVMQLPELQDLAKKQAGLAERAVRYRMGFETYVGCNTLSPAGHSLHRNVVHWPYLLRGLWGQAVPSRLSLINFGCSNLTDGESRESRSSDPLKELTNLPTKLDGLCVDMEAAWLSDSQAKLQGHNISFVQAVINPRNVQDLIRDEYGRDVVDFLKVDIDSFDASILQATLQVLSATIVIVEFDPSIPPPFRFAMHFSEEWFRVKPFHQFKYCRDEVPSQPQDYTCTHFAHPMVSISYLVGYLSEQGYHLYKMNEADAIFVNQRFATSFEQAEDGLRFPIDEWACYMQTPVITKPWPFPAQFTQEWMADDHVYTAFSRLWGNMSRFSRINHFEHVPFTLDLAGGSGQVKFGAPNVREESHNEASFFGSCSRGQGVMNLC